MGINVSPLTDQMGWHVLLEKLRKWTQPLDLTATLELRDELSKVRKKDDPEVLSNALSAIENECELAGVSVDEIEFVTALISAAPRDCLSYRKG